MQKKQTNSKTANNSSGHTTIDYVKKKALQTGCIIVSTTKNESDDISQVTIVPSCGHGVKTVSAMSFAFNNTRSEDLCLCKDCLYEKYIKPIEDHGYKILDKWYSENGYVFQNIRAQALCGHTVTISPRFFVPRTMCNACRDKSRADEQLANVRELCKQLGCVCVRDFFENKTHKYEIKGTCGHVFIISGTAFLYRESGICFKCARKHVSEMSVLKVCSQIFGDKNTVHQFLIKTPNELPFGRVHCQYIDIAIPKAKLAIEYNGVQHYEKTKWFHKDEEDFEYQQERDARKRQWCSDNNYCLVEIDGRAKENRGIGITEERVSVEIEKQTGHPVDYFKKILEEENEKVHT